MLAGRLVAASSGVIALVAVVLLPPPAFLGTAWRQAAAYSLAWDSSPGCCG